MTFEVVVQRLARLDILEAWSPAYTNAPEAAERWLRRLQDTFHSLDTNPQRCPFAFENDEVEFELRELLFGRRPHVFRIIFTIDDSRVRVLRVLRAQRRFLTRRQVIDALVDK